MRKICSLSGLFILMALLALSGCGGSSNPTMPPVVGSFTNASFAGSYAFTANGVNGSGIFTLMGILQADGNGNISSGRTFYNSTATGFAGNFALTGTYLVAPDGRTNVNLNADFIGPVNLDLVLLSQEHGLVVRFDNTATASGSLDKQNPAAFSAAAMAGTYVFNLLGTDSIGQPEASVGSFTVDSASNIIGGVQDTNDNGVITANAPILSGPTSVFDVVPGIGNGVFSYTTAPEGLRSFGLVVVDANHIKFISNDSTILQAGDLYRLAPAGVSGSLAFAMEGTSTNGAFATGGILNTDGAGNILNTSVADSNNGGLVSLNSALGGTYSVSGNRTVVTLNGGTINLAAYPSAGGFQVVSLDSSTVASGTAFQQSGTLSNATLNGRYGANLSGFSTAGKFDAVAQVTADGKGHVAGLFSLNDDGSLKPDLSLNGNYALGVNGRAEGNLVTSAGTLNVVYYVASSKQVLFIEVDSNRVSEGLLTQQQ
jgi:hypothetical protein